MTYIEMYCAESGADLFPSTANLLTWRRGSLIELLMAQCAAAVLVNTAGSLEWACDFLMNVVKREGRVLEWNCTCADAWTDGERAAYASGK